MNIFAQHAYGKGEKLEKGITDLGIDGVILSPRAEKLSTLKQTIDELKKHPRCQTLIDPQFYYSAISPVKVGNLPEYPYFQPGLSRVNFLSATLINDYVDKVLQFQAQFAVDYILSPTVLFTSFEDTWSQVSLQLAQASTERYKALNLTIPLLISIVVDETAFAQTNAMDQYLNLLTTLEAQGFYIIVRRNVSTYRPQMDPAYLENYLYFVYSLTDINDFTVLLGYADFVGIIFHCFNILGTSTGWFSTSRQFSSSTYEPQTGGAQPKPRYSSESLLNSVTLFPELDGLCLSGFAKEIVSNTIYDGHLSTSREPWSNETSALHHWAVLNKLSRDVRTGTSTAQRLTGLVTKIDEAQLLYQSLRNAGHVFEPNSNGSHLEQWKRAIQGFRAKVRI